MKLRCSHETSFVLGRRCRGHFATLHKGLLWFLTMLGSISWKSYTHRSLKEHFMPHLFSLAVFFKWAQWLNDSVHRHAVVTDQGSIKEWVLLGLGYPPHKDGFLSVCVCVGMKVAQKTAARTKKQQQQKRQKNRSSDSDVLWGRLLCSTASVQKKK